jgi:starch-binding outer membrane protein, SusD/RagB family
MRGGIDMMRPETGVPRSAGRYAAAAALAALLGTGACDGINRLLDVDAPSQIPVGVLDDPIKAPLLVNGVIANFECAFGAYVVLSGILGEELIETTQTANRWPYERREVQASDALYGTFGCEALGVYVPFSTARWTADEVLRQLEGWTDAQMPAGANRNQLIATTAAYGGYSYLMMGEAFCSMAFDAGPEVTSQQAFALAEERFTRAIQAGTAAGSAAGTDLANMARLGRARSRLNRGLYAEAAADAALVPLAYVRNATSSAASSRRNNRVFAQNGPNSSATTVGPRYRGMTVGGVPDTRVVVVDGGRNAIDGNRIWEQRKYPNSAAPIPLATGREAILIRAEAAARAGQLAVAEGLINQLRTRAGLPAFDATDMTQSQVLEQVIEERRRELFLESHHFFDIRRFNLALVPAPGTVFPKGGTYGSTRCLPLPDIERLNNPNIG